MTDKEALKLALEAITTYLSESPDPSEEAVEGLCDAASVARRTLAQPEQEPVALEEAYSLLLWDYQELERAFNKVTGGTWIRKSNTPSQRKWVGLTFAEICECENDYLHLFARAIESKLKELNHEH